MSGDNAQGLLWDIKSCSNVGSIYLTQVGERPQQVESVRVQAAQAQAIYTHFMN